MEKGGYERVIFHHSVVSWGRMSVTKVSGLLYQDSWVQCRRDSLDPRDSIEKDQKGKEDQNGWKVQEGWELKKKGQKKEASSRLGLEG